MVENRHIRQGTVEESHSRYIADYQGGSHDQYVTYLYITDISLPILKEKRERVLI